MDIFDETLSEKEKQIIIKWKSVVYDRAAEIDPDDEHDWHSMALGFFLAYGLSPDSANSLATYARYRLEIA
jgi:hypothetical protein